MPSNKPYFNTRLTPEAKSLVQALADYYGISQSAVIEILIRDRSRELRIGMFAPATPRESNTSR